jgi:glycosyltransferase involved in cell wall biosynthesis
MSRSLAADEITIAITVYNRRRYVEQAICSALNQTASVGVMVMDDFGPDPSLQDFVKGKFGARVKYIRNPVRRGLFGNLNACLELCSTPWLSILHDDDYLAPEFIEAMLELYRYCPDCGLYFGGTTMVNDTGDPLFEWASPALPKRWRRVTLQDVKWATPFAFPGQLINVEHALAVGGFRKTSQYCGDWEVWCKLIAHYGGACTGATVAFYRQHADWERASNRVLRAGKVYPLNYVQIKRAFHLLRQAGVPEKIDRITYQKQRPISTRFLLRHGVNLSPRMLCYYRRLLLLSAPAHLGYAVIQFAVLIFGVRFLRWTSQIWNRLFPIRCAQSWDKSEDSKN